MSHKSKTMKELIRSLQGKGVLKSAAIARAMAKVDRGDFVPKESRGMVYQDTVLPIGSGQTISQPYTVVFMLELLEPKLGQNIMEVGYGSGWQTAILAEIVGKRGVVHSIERLPTLCKFGKTNVSKYPDLVKRIKFYCQDASSGLPFSFDRIIAAAEVREVPPAWRRQLKIGGRLVYPKTGSVFKEIKKNENDFSVEEYPGFSFVPFVEKSK